MGNKGSDNNMSFEEFRQHLTNMTSDGDFSFGFNWLDYVKTRLNEDIINQHISNLIKVYGSSMSFEGKSVYDIGCGSGLSSVSFAKLGCNKILSVDVDTFSVQATNYTREHFSPPNIDWTVQHHSILDESIVEPESFDIVYSWGVLHHTGNMWQAIKNSIPIVKPEGYFHVALYRSGPSYMKHIEDKFRFKFADREEKMRMVYAKKGSTDFVNTDSRGMNKFHDTLDWLGGLPYEVCDPEILNAFLESKGFQQVSYVDKKEGGCFISIYKKVR